MELKAAIERAVRFCPKGKTNLVNLQAVRFVPQTVNCPAVIYSTSGHLGTIVELRDVEIPDALIPVTALRKAIRDAKSVDSIEAIKPGVFAITVTAKKSGEQMTYEVNGGDTLNFPGLPVVPVPSAFEDVLGWDTVLKVLPAVGKKDHEPDLKLVRFHPRHVTATNLELLIRVNRALGWDAWVLAEVFRSWPKGPVSVAWDASYGFFRVGDETRFAARQKEARHQDSFGRYCSYTPPYYVVLSRVLLEDTIKRAQDVSPWRVVSFDFCETSVIVRAFARNREADQDARFEAEIPYVKSCVQPMQALLDSTILVSIFKLIGSPMVRLRYEAPNIPIQFESGDIQFVVHPTEWKRKDDR